MIRTNITATKIWEPKWNPIIKINKPEILKSDISTAKTSKFQYTQMESNKIMKQPIKKAQYSKAKKKIQMTQMETNEQNYVTATW